MAVGADGDDHIQVERDFLRPAGIPSWVFGAAGLIDLAEAAIGGGALPPMLDRP